MPYKNPADRAAREKERRTERNAQKKRQREAKKIDAENWSAPQLDVVLSSDSPRQRNTEAEELTAPLAADAVLLRERLSLIKALCQHATTTVGSGPLKTQEYLDRHNVIRPRVELQVNASEYSQGNRKPWEIRMWAIQAQFRVLTTIAYTFEDEKDCFNFRSTRQVKELHDCNSCTVRCTATTAVAVPQAPRQPLLPSWFGSNPARKEYPHELLGHGFQRYTQWRNGEDNPVRLEGRRIAGVIKPEPKAEIVLPVIYPRHNFYHEELSVPSFHLESHDTPEKLFIPKPRIVFSHWPYILLQTTKGPALARTSTGP